MERTSGRNQLVLTLIALVVATAAILTFVAIATDDGEPPGTPSSTTSVGPPVSEATSSTTTSVRPTPTTVDPAVLDVAVYPDLAKGTRFSDPRDLVLAFATEVLGFDTDVVVSTMAQGDLRSGEIELTPPGSTAVTTVPVRLIDDGSWIVLGAITDSIVLDSPRPGATVTSPLALSGSASAFEGHVDVTLLPDGGNTPIGTTFVTGRGDGELGAFLGQLTFEAEGDRGVLVLSAPSGEDGTTNAAMAIRVRFR